ncbi:hypothetical protein ACMA5I_14940 [Paracoccaceae bacterium GXU_MW_L88]
MALKRVKVTGHIGTSGGEPVTGGKVRFALDRTDFDGTIAVATNETFEVALSAEADGTARFEAEVWPNARGTEGSRYQVVAQYHYRAEDGATQSAKLDYGALTVLDVPAQDISSLRPAAALVPRKLRFVTAEAFAAMDEANRSAGNFAILREAADGPFANVLGYADALWLEGRCVHQIFEDGAESWHAAAPKPEIGLSDLSLADGAEAGDVVAQIGATMAGDLRFTLAGGAGLFAIDGAALTLARDLEATDIPPFAVTITATSGEASVSQSFALTIDGDVPRGLVVDPAAPLVAAKTPAGTEIAQLHADNSDVEFALTESDGPFAVRGRALITTGPVAADALYTLTITANNAMGEAQILLNIATLPAEIIDDTPAESDLTLTPFTRDLTIFDSGAAFGRDVATVPLSGTATAGAEIEARAVSTEDEGATSTAWQRVGAADADGDWQGEISVLRNTSWYRVELRAAGDADARVTSEQRFGAGHVVALLDQSLKAQIFSGQDGTDGPALSLPEGDIQVVYSDESQDASAPKLVHVKAAAGVKASMEAMAETLSGTLPGEKVMFVDLAQSGEALSVLVDDIKSERKWTDLEASVALARADGAEIGALLFWHYATSASKWGPNYGQNLMAVALGQDWDGTTLGRGSVTVTGPAGQSSIRLDHAFTDLFDPAVTRFCLMAPEKRVLKEDLSNAVTLADGEATSHMHMAYEAAHLSVRALAENPAAGGAFAYVGFAPTSFRTGSAVSPLDPHASPDDADGIERLGRLVAVGAIYALGLSETPLPVLDQAELSADGVTLYWGSSAGALTTTRLARGLPPIDGTDAHRTEVMGFEVNGVAASYAAIEGGRVALRKPDGALWTKEDVVTYGRGGATGMLRVEADQAAEAWMNTPLLASDVYPGLEGVPVATLPDNAAVFAALSEVTNTGAAVRLASGGTWLQSPSYSAMDATPKGVTIEIEGEFALPPSAFYTLAADPGLQFVWQLGSTAKGVAERILVKDPETRVKSEFGDYATRQVPDIAAITRLRLSLDMETGRIKTFHNDALWTDAVIADPYGSMDPTRLLLLFNKSLHSANEPLAGEAISGVRVWFETTAEGSVPSRQPDFVLGGTLGEWTGDLGGWTLLGDAPSAA